MKKTLSSLGNNTQLLSSLVLKLVDPSHTIIEKTNKKLQAIGGQDLSEVYDLYSLGNIMSPSLVPS